MLAKAAASLFGLVAGAAGALLLTVLLVGVVISFFGSFLSLFFSGDDGTVPEGIETMPLVINEINLEFSDVINEIIANTDCDEVEGPNGSPPAWKDVLIVYTHNCLEIYGDEAASITEAKKDILRETFWSMCAINTYVTTYEIPGETSSDPETGEDTSDPPIIVTVLNIDIISKTAEDMAVGNPSLAAMAVEMKSADYNDLWVPVLIGSRGEITGGALTTALLEIGNLGGEKYWSWYGYEDWVNWCACFVSWWAFQNGYLGTAIPKFSNVDWEGSAWFKLRGQWQEPKIVDDSGRLAPYQALPGDLIFFDWNRDGTPDHVGIVLSSDRYSVNTIEGNAGESPGKVKQNIYSISSTMIYGYGIPLYP
jgi:hypothetical protein